MKLVALMRYGDESASTRARLLQYLPHLAKAGVDVDVRPLWDRQRVEALFAKRRLAPRYVVERAVRRLRDVARARSADAVWVDTEVLPYVPGFVEELLAWRGPPLIVDHDDATWVKYDDDAGAVVRAAMRGKIDRLMRLAAVVVAGNNVIADHARAAGARRVVVVPTVVDMEHYPASPAPPLSALAPLRVGFIGTPHTARYLSILAKPLRAAGDEVPLKLVVVGADATFLEVVTECLPWSVESEAESLASFHVGVMPLPDAPFERGKCGYKLIQCMAAGRPVVASPVGVNAEIVDDSVGFLAHDDASWVKALVTLAKDAPLRARMGAAARARVIERYSLAVTAPQLVDVVMSVIRR